MKAYAAVLVTSIAIGCGSPRNPGSCLDYATGRVDACRRQDDEDCTALFAPVYEACESDRRGGMVPTAIPECPTCPKCSACAECPNPHKTDITLCALGCIALCKPDNKLPADDGCLASCIFTSQCGFQPEDHAP